MLEYLVCPDPVPAGTPDKHYEALLGISPGDWARLHRTLTAFPNAQMRIAWRCDDGRTWLSRLADLYAGAEPRLQDGGLILGGNRDVSANPHLPPPGATVAILVSRPTPPDGEIR
ncbi:MAG: hypothetical protein HY608_08935 [Planctomycetes bacterium]|nr:hypothetical protein [Planctomycetota bacterium]